MVEFKHNSGFVLDGLNLEAPVELYPWEAALGTEISISTLDGKISVKVPAGIQNGNRIRVNGKGYKDRNGNRGDLFLRVKLVNPESRITSYNVCYTKLLRSGIKKNAPPG